ncbi:1-acyl-sn-glycerol-3-phosphate acyltransferase [Alteromonas sp. SM 2104]|nr:1-acyl-sn-glycerol-3-phosphate acyltransferase [Alteromonas oceanisediminis]
MVLAVGPHTSNWDFFLGVAVLFALGIKIRFLGKHTIFVPGIRWWLKSIGGIPVNRRAAHGMVEQVTNIFQTQKKMILAVAPEGTRSYIHPWKSGFIRIAHRADVPVVLIGFDFVRKAVVLGPHFSPSGDIEKDMQTVYSFYASVPAKYPVNTSAHSAVANGDVSSDQ